MKIRANECVMYTLLWCVYYMQGILYPVGSIISQGLLMIILTLSLYYAYVDFSKYTLPSFLKVTTLFVVFFLVYGLFSFLDPDPIYKNFVLEEKVSVFTHIKMVLMSILPLYPYYYFTRKGLLNPQNLHYYFLCFIIVFTLTFIRNQNELMQVAISLRSNQEEFTNNIAYDLLQLMPLLVLLRHKPRFQFFSVIYIMVFLIIGMKRGALLIGVICFLFFFYNYLKYSSKTSRVRALILLAFAFAILISFGVSFFETSEYFQNRLEDTIAGDSSGRDVKYSMLLQHLKDRSSISAILWGDGINETIKISGNYAHNDWLELGVNMGLLGIVLYVMYYLVLLFEIKKNKRQNHHIISTSLAMCFIIMFLSSIFSMSYYSMTVALTLTLGYSMATRSVTQLNIYEGKKNYMLYR